MSLIVLLTPYSHSRKARITRGRTHSTYLIGGSQTVHCCVCTVITDSPNSWNPRPSESLQHNLHWRSEVVVHWLYSVIELYIVTCVQVMTEWIIQSHDWSWSVCSLELKHVVFEFPTSSHKTLGSEAHTDVHILLDNVYESLNYWYMSPYCYFCLLLIDKVRVKQMIYLNLAKKLFVVYYETIKWELKIKPISECRCDKKTKN